MNETSPTLDLDKALATAQKAAQAGSKVLLEHYGRLRHVSEKHLAGLVSEADVASEQVIRRVLEEDFPIRFLGEEMAGDQEGGWPVSGNWWIVDPLDGTTNYVHRFPIFCISIGLMWNGELVLGLVDMPKLGVTYWASRGRGAYVNGQPIKVSERSVVRDSLLATGFFRDHHESLREQLGIFSRLVYEARGIRRAGAAAYDLCLVAEGVFEGFWEKNLKPWDTAAGVVIIEEAGGRVTDYTGRPFDFSADSVVATNGRLHEILLSTIQGAG